MQCKDFYIIRVYKKQYKKQIKNNEIIKQFIDFKWDIVEKFTGKSSEYWYWNYMQETYECAFEEIYENKNIIILDNLKHVEFFIPRENDADYSKIISIIENHKLKYKNLKKISLGFVEHYYGETRNLNYYRTYSHKFSINTEAYKIYSRKKKMENLTNA